MNKRENRHTFVIMGVSIDVLNALPRNLDKSFKKSLKYLTKHTRSIKNALILPYSNGKLEGKNNLIKVLQRIAFGLRNFENMRRRISLYEENWQTKKQRNENVDEKLLKTFSQSHSKCNRWLYQLCKGYASVQVHPCTPPATCSYISVD